MTNVGRRRFDLWELVVISSIALLIGLVSSRAFRQNQAPAEARPLEARYGPARNSEHEEEWMIRDFFQDQKNGFFVDVGANHYRIYSNTYYLETALGWSGLAIEPLEEFAADYAEYRPRSRFVPLFVSDQSNQNATMFLNRGNSLVTSSEKSFTQRWGSKVEEVEARTITLNDLFEAEHVSKIDFVSMDIELAEPKALAGFDIERVRPRLLCVEAHPEVRQQILDYFAHHHYVVVGKYLRADTQNLWFMPLDTTAS